MSKSSRSNFDRDRQDSDSSDSSTSSWVRILNQSIIAGEISEDDIERKASFPEPEREATIEPKTFQPLHRPGICQPCLFFWSQRWRCAKGDRCQYCHHHDFPPVQGRTRPTKAVREKIQRRLLPLLHRLDACDPSVGLVEKTWWLSTKINDQHEFLDAWCSWCFLIRNFAVKHQYLVFSEDDTTVRLEATNYVAVVFCRIARSAGNARIPSLLPRGGGKHRNHCSVLIASLVFLYARHNETIKNLFLSEKANHGNPPHCRCAVCLVQSQAWHSVHDPTSEDNQQWFLKACTELMESNLERHQFVWHQSICST